MARLGIVTPMRLGRRVEMKAAHAELVIKYQTCGSPGFQLGTAAARRRRLGRAGASHTAVARLLSD